MKKRGTALAFAVTFGLALSALASDKPQPVRTGSGVVTFDTVPGWGLAPDGKSVIGPCHGGVAVGKDGTIYTSSHAGVFAFSPDVRWVEAAVLAVGSIIGGQAGAYLLARVNVTLLRVFVVAIGVLLTIGLFVRAYSA